MNVNINIESRVLLVVHEDILKYQIYHIKCPALQRNGLMFVTAVGNFTETQGLIYENPFKKIDFLMHATVLKIATCVKYLIFIEA